MNDEQMQTRLETWFGDTDPAPPNARQTTVQVMARVPQTRQRGRWWPFPSFEPKVQTATLTDTAEYRPSPVPATNGHAPTVIGRTQTMFSPVKAIIGGALVFALSAAFLVTQPFEQQGSVPGAEQGAELAAPVEVTATYTGIGPCTDGSIEMDGYFARGYGFTCTVYNEWSDPRLQGTETYVDNSVEYMDEGELSIGHFVHNIVTDDGAWRMRPQFRISSTGGPENFSGTWVLDGEDAYEGLSVVLVKTDSESDPLHGFIISTDLVPPPPEAGSTK